MKAVVPGSFLPTFLFFFFLEREREGERGEITPGPCLLIMRDAQRKHCAAAAAAAGGLGMLVGWAEPVSAPAGLFC